MPKHAGSRIAVAVVLVLATGAARIGADRDWCGRQENFRLLSVAAGPRGSEVGTQFRLDEVRSQFNRQRDSQVIVYFQWDGAPGKHRLAARWRGPGGSVSTQSEFDYDARDRQFGAYWVLPLSPSTPTGTWSIEATINGLPSGSLSFAVVDDNVTPGQTTRRPLEPAQIYERARRVFVVIQRSSPMMALGSTVAGMVVAPGRIATVFPAIDATDTLSATLADGSTMAGLGIAVWNRSQAWAVLAAESAGSPPGPPSLPAAGPMKVGDRCYSMMGGTGGAHVLVEGSIVGTGASAGGWQSYVANFFSGVAFPGAPVLDEFGDVVGIIGATAMLAPSSLVRQMSGDRMGMGFATGPVIPVRLLTAAGGAAPASIEELRRRGVLVRPVSGDHVMSGGFARQITTRQGVRPVDQREEFGAGEGGSIYTFVSWDPKTRLKGMLLLRLFDQDNRAVLESKPKKTDLKPGDMVFSHWQVPLPARVGIYRADVMIGEDVAWRGYFRVVQ